MIIHYTYSEVKERTMTDYRNHAIELVEELNADPMDMLIAALKYMSNDDVRDMLETNEYPAPIEEDA